MSAPVADPAPRLREIVTPEGVPLRFAVALAGDRVGALVLDLLIVAGVVLALALAVLALTASGSSARDLGFAFVTASTFLVRAFYFPFFELAWQGQTPGKRRMRIRAVDARGGPLSTEAILARNLTRELEVFLPVVALVAGGAVFPGAPGIARLAALGWMILFGFLPLFNRDRLRVGDLVAGTLVVQVPGAILLDDLTTREAPAPAPGAGAPAPLTFTSAQLEVYGEYELSVLEGLLRDEGSPARAESVKAVAGRIRKKIGWDGPAGDDLGFLRAFYAAQRGRLERGLLLGRRRRHKGDGS